MIRIQHQMRSQSARTASTQTSPDFVFAHAKRMGAFAALVLFSLTSGFAGAETSKTTISLPTSSPVIEPAGDNPGAEAENTHDAGSEAASPAAPEEGELRTKLLGTKKFEDTSGITDVRIRADAGSMSRFSAKFSLTYYGPPAGDLSSLKQPNPDGSIGNFNTSLAGSVGLRYRIDATRALSFGTGLNAITPFQELKRVDVRTPYFSFDKTYRIGEWQMRHSPGVNLVTTPEYLNVGEYGTLNYDAAIYRGLGRSRWSVGLDSSFSYFLYKRPYIPKDRTASRDNWGVFPTVKYRANDQIGVYTSVSLSYYNPRKVQSELIMEYRTVSQRLGLEYAINRDIYISPYINFYPQAVSINSTTINFNTVFSVL